MDYLLNPLSYTMVAIDMDQSPPSAVVVIGSMSIALDVWAMVSLCQPNHMLWYSLEASHCFQGVPLTYVFIKKKKHHHFIVENISLQKLYCNCFYI